PPPQPSPFQREAARGPCPAAEPSPAARQLLRNLQTPKRPRGHEMKLKTTVLALAIAAASLAIPAQAATFRFAFQGELKSLDPYSLNESFTLGVLGNVYEGLTKRGPNLEIIPGLAERWEIVEPTRWRFYLRKGVKFQNGEDFTA